MSDNIEDKYIVPRYPIQNRANEIIEKIVGTKPGAEEKVNSTEDEKSKPNEENSEMSDKDVFKIFEFMLLQPVKIILSQIKDHKLAVKIIQFLNRCINCTKTLVFDINPSEISPDLLNEIKESTFFDTIEIANESPDLDQYLPTNNVNHIIINSNCINLLEKVRVKFPRITYFKNEDGIIEITLFRNNIERFVYDASKIDISSLPKYERYTKYIKFENLESKNQFPLLNSLKQKTLRCSYVTIDVSNMNVNGEDKTTTKPDSEKNYTITGFIFDGNQLSDDIFDFLMNLEVLIKISFNYCKIYPNFIIKFEKLLKKQGKQLMHIDINGLELNEEEYLQVINIIDQYCPYVARLYIANDKMNSKSEEKVLEIVKNRTKELSLDVFSKYFTPQKYFDFIIKINLLSYSLQIKWHKEMVKYIYDSLISDIPDLKTLFYYSYYINELARFKPLYDRSDENWLDISYKFLNQDEIKHPLEKQKHIKLNEIQYCQAVVFLGEGSFGKCYITKYIEGLESQYIVVKIAKDLSIHASSSNERIPTGVPGIQQISVQSTNTHDDDEEEQEEVYNTWAQYLKANSLCVKVRSFPDCSFQCMDYIPGPSLNLASQIDFYPKDPFTLCLAEFRTMASLMSMFVTFEETHLIHPDISFNNIILDSEFYAHICDFDDLDPSLTDRPHTHGFYNPDPKPGYNPYVYPLGANVYTMITREPHNNNQNTEEPWCHNYKYSDENYTNPRYEGLKPNYRKTLMKEIVYKMCFEKRNEIKHISEIIKTLKDIAYNLKPKDIAENATDAQIEELKEDINTAFIKCYNEVLERNQPRSKWYYGTDAEVKKLISYANYYIKDSEEHKENYHVKSEKDRSAFIKIIKALENSLK